MRADTETPLLAACFRSCEYWLGVMRKAISFEPACFCVRSMFRGRAISLDNTPRNYAPVVSYNNSEEVYSPLRFHHFCFLISAPEVSC